MDEDNCMVDVARYFIEFLSDESCGKCVPCRNGLVQMHSMLTEICKGKGKEGGGPRRRGLTSPRISPDYRRVSATVSRGSAIG